MEKHNPVTISHAVRAGITTLVALAIGAGCAVGPNYQRPAVVTPDHFRFAENPPPDSLGDLPWWKVFQDPALQELIRAALTNNFDLKQAVARVEQARNLALAARAPLFPQIGYGGAVGRGRNALLNTPTPMSGATESSAYGNLNAVWELDLWGRIRRLSESARAQYLATEEARRGVTITLVSDVATAYFRLLQYDQELAIQQSATNAYAESYRIFDERLTGGAASKLETYRADAARANAAALIPQLELNVAITENQINVLLGRRPGPVARNALTNEPPLAPEIPPGLPSELLRRRPDILAAEQMLIAANAGIGANLANFFPRIGLTTFIGQVSPELSAFTAGSANAWNVGATLSGPLFQGGQLRAQYRAAQAKFDEAGAAYQQSVLTAFQEVADALIARQKFSETCRFDGQAAVALTASVGLATARYRNGRSGYYEVLETQQELYPTQRAQAEAQAGERIAVIQLYKALGGGWEVTAQPGNSNPLP
jgi:multidrug efflux system outer membrane protein